MSMYCEISLNKPPYGAFVGVRGNVISGVIRYSTDVPMPIDRIFACIEGRGTLKLENLQKKDEEGNPEVEIRRESYLDVTIVNEHSNIENIFVCGVYEMPFSVEIPHDIPPSLNYNKNGLSHNISCEILYHVRISIKPSFFPHNREFRREIKVIAGLVPKFPMTSVIHDGEKKLTQLFSSNESYVKVRANIYNSVLRCGEKIQLQCEVNNDTNITITGVKVKVIEVYIFKATDGGEIVMQEKIPYTVWKTHSIPSRETLEKFLEIYMPEDRESLDFANFVSREYFVLITVKLPMPHRDYELKIPFQTGHTHDGQEVGSSPLLWELMYENNDGAVHD